MSYEISTMSEPLSAYIAWCKWIKDTQDKKDVRETFEFEYAFRDMGDKLAETFDPDSEEYYEYWDAMDTTIYLYSENADKIWGVFRVFEQ